MGVKTEKGFMEQEKLYELLRYGKSQVITQKGTKVYIDLTEEAENWVGEEVKDGKKLLMRFKKLEEEVIPLIEKSNPDEKDKELALGELKEFKKILKRSQEK